jgi:hypothetical protein
MPRLFSSPAIAFTDVLPSARMASIPTLAAFDPSTYSCTSVPRPAVQVVLDRLALRLDPKHGRNLPAALRSC